MEKHYRRLSAASMLWLTFDLDEEARAVEGAINKVLDEGYRTIDIMPAPGKDTSNITQVGTKKMGDLIVEHL